MNNLMQLLSIIISLSCIMFFWNRLLYMRYSFPQILVRFIFYKDTKPFAWLYENLEYLAFLMIFLGHIFSIFGLLQQFGLNQVNDKPFVFFISSPINNLGMILMGYTYSHKFSKYMQSTKY